MPRRDTIHIALDSAVTKTASYAPPARDCNLDRFNELVVTLNITAAERTTTQTYDFYLITGDGFSEWDLVHFPQIAVAGATKLTARVLSPVLPQAVTAAAPGVATVAPAIINTLATNAPKTLGAGLVAHGPWGNYLRYELVCGGTITTGITYTLQVEAAWSTGRAAWNAGASSGGGGGATFDFYVDSVAGVDANPGTLALPWKTVSKVNGASLTAGQSVGFKSGQMWRELLTLPSGGASGNPVTYGAYGTGAAPIITGSDLVTAGWTVSAGSVWQTPAAVKPNIVYFDGQRGTLMASAAAIIAPLQWFWAPNVLYVWSPSGADPSLFYVAPGIETGSRNRALQINDKNWVTLSGINFRDGNALADNTVNVGSNSVVGVVFQNCVVERGASNGLELKGSVTPTSVTITNCTIQNNGGWGILSDFTYAGPVVISNNTIAGNGWASVRDSQEYSGIEGQLGNFTITGNTIRDHAGTNPSGQCHGIYVLASAVVVTISNNTIYNIPQGDGIKTRGSANISGNILRNNGAAGIEVGGNAAVNIVVNCSYNTIYNNNSLNNSQGIAEQTKGAGTLTLNLYHNTCYNNGNTSQQEIKYTDTPTAADVRNNIMFTSPTRRSMAILAVSPMTIDYNLHWNPGGPPNPTIAGSGQTWAQWQTAGCDVHGKNLDPLFTNAAAGNFTLQAGSPALAAGIFIPGVSLANPPNMGSI